MSRPPYTLGITRVKEHRFSSESKELATTIIVLVRDAAPEWTRQVESYLGTVQEVSLLARDLRQDYNLTVSTYAGCCAPSQTEARVAVRVATLEVAKPGEAVVASVLRFAHVPAGVSAIEAETECIEV